LQRDVNIRVKYALSKQRFKKKNQKGRSGKFKKFLLKKPAKLPQTWDLAEVSP